MIVRTVGELAALLDATLLGQAPLDPRTAGPDPLATEVTSVVVDSRAATPGSLFVALPGERVDGHAYVATALAAGAAAALVRDPVPDAGGPCLQVADPLAALGRLAHEQVALGRAGGLRVVAVTGSQGKTSTKDLLGQTLAAAGPTVAPAGNLNNEIGLPLTVARITAGTRYLVAEMGARGIGHIAYLCGIVRPQVGVVLNVGTAHVGEFGSREAIARAKGELVEALDPDGVAVLNADDPLVLAMADRTRARVVRTSTTGDPGGPEAVWGSDVRPDALGRCAFRLHRRVGSTETHAAVQLAVSGRHQVANACAAAAAALAVGLDLEQVAHGLSAAGPRSRWRMELHERSDGVLVVNDAYNANPESMHAALDTLVEIAARRGGVAWAVLGDMLELGPGARSDHEQLGRYAAERGIGQLVAVGDFADAVVAGAASTGYRLGTRTLTRDEVAPTLATELAAADVVLVKASRGLALDTVAEAIQAVDPAGPDHRSSEDSA